MKLSIKKSCSVILSVFMLLSCFTIQGFAASSQVNDKDKADAVISIGSATLSNTSDEVRLPVTLSLKNNAKVDALGLAFDYDSENLELEEIDNAIDMSALIAPLLNSGTPNGNEITWAGADKNVLSNDLITKQKTDIMFWLKFKAKNGYINGSYNISASILDDQEGNFAYLTKGVPVYFANGSVKLTGGADKLTRANTTISGIETSYEWTGSAIEPKPVVSYNGKTLTEDTDYTVSYESNTNIGTATLTVTGEGSYLGSVETTFEITKKAAKITVSTTSYTKKYGDEAFPLGASVNSGATLSYVSDRPEVASVDTSGNVAINGEGTAIITVSAEATDTYQKPENVEVKVIVSKADQKITGINDLNLTYGDDSVDLKPVLNPPTDAKVTYRSSKPQVVGVDDSGKVSVNVVGVATITVTASEVTGKYNSATKEIKVTVAPKELIVTGITAESKTYDTNTSAKLKYPPSIDGVKAGDTVEVTAKGTFADANAGEGKIVNITDIKLGGDSAANYVLAKSGNQTTTTADITKAAYTGSVSAKATVPANKAMTGRTVDISAFDLTEGFVDARIANVTVTSNEDGLIVGEPSVSSSGTVLTYDTAAVAKDKTAKITVAILSRNYTDVLTTITITSKDVIVDWDSYFTKKDSVVYGTKKSEMFSKSITAGTAAADGKALTGIFEIVGASEIPAVSEDNTVTVKFTVTSDGDYNGVVLTNPYKIPVTKKEIGLTWSNDKNLVYDGKAKNVTASATGLVGDDEAAVTVTDGNATNAGKYTATATALTGSAAGNYQLPASFTHEYTIEKADYTVELSAASVYVKVGTESVSFLPTASAKGVGDEQPAGTLKFYSDSARNNELTAAAVKALNIGDHTVYWSFKTSDANYVDTAKTGKIKLTVTDGDPQNIAISGLDGKTYGDALFNAIAAVTTTDGAEAKDHGAITWSSSNTKVAEIDPATGAVTINGAGETTITAKAAKVAGKYAAGERSATLTVAKKTLTIESITAANKTYDGKKDATLTVNVSGAVAGDKVTATATGEFADAAVGTNKAVTVKSIELDEASSANYTTPEKLPEVKASITKIASKDVKLEYPDLNQKTGSITKPTVKLTPEDSSAEVKIFIKKTVKDETTGDEKTVTEEWNDKTAPTAAGTYIVYAEITSRNIDGTITTPDQKLTITQRSSGGGGGAAVTTYKVTLDKAMNGTVKASASSVEKGKTVTITATPAEGYETASVKVTDASGKNVDVTKNSDGTYKFTMPDGNVTVKAEFAKKAENDTVCADMKDIDQSKWYHEAVHYVGEKGIMNGYNKNEFGPNDTLSRAMLAQILYNNAGKPTAAKNTSCSDIKPGDWFASAVNWASENNIVTGFTDGTFKPGANITREQLAVMLYRYAGQPATTGSLASFTDAASVSGYAQQAMQWATANGIITGNGSATTLDPQGNATRAQAAAMIMRYLEKK